jgi:hypothetical protein
LSRRIDRKAALDSRSFRLERDLTGGMTLPICRRR